MSSVFEEEQPQGFDSFPPEIREDVEGLIWLGYLEDHYEFCGHDFVLRTLRGDEELLAGLITKEFVETLGQSRAWAWAQVALALVAIDGEDDFCPPVGPDKRAYARARFQYCTSRWFWPLGQRLFRRYAELLERQEAAIEALEDFTSGSLPTSTPSASSLTEKGDLTPQEDIRDHLDLEDTTD